MQWMICLTMSLHVKICSEYVMYSRELETRNSHIGPVSVCDKSAEALFSLQGEEGYYKLLCGFTESLELTSQQKEASQIPREKQAIQQLTSGRIPYVPMDKTFLY